MDARSLFGRTFLMSDETTNVVNLAEYRRKRDAEEIERLKAALDDIIASLPPMSQEAYFIMDELVFREPYILPQTNLDTYYDNEDEE